jgi:DNA-binding transcriptional MerR regulator
MQMKLSIGEAAQRLGVSVRTLRHYDEIVLVSPAQVGENGYRYYDREALALLQQAIFYRELGLPLKEIKPLLQAPEEQRRRALEAHRSLLELKIQQLEGLVALVDDTLGGAPMTKPKITQTDIDAAREQYAEEAKARWGHTEAWQQSAGKTPDAAAMEDIFRGFSALRDTDPGSPEAQAQVKVWQDFITDNLYTCTKEILAGLGQMYICDERFTANLDKYGEGTARFMSEAIKIYCEA